MAIYHLRASMISRSAGRSATGAAAYRSGECIHDLRTGLDFDYRARSGVEHVEILAPGHAPEWVHDRSALWNRVEAAETRKNSQLAREVRVALPAELSHEERVELVRDFCQRSFVDRGMVADIALHAPGLTGDERNHHAHIMLTTREIDAEGFTAKNRDWNAVAVLEDWREAWAHDTNAALERAGHELRVDHRTLEAQREEALELAAEAHEQGDEALALAETVRAISLDRSPLPQLSVGAWQMKARGHEVGAVGLWQEVKAQAAEVARVVERLSVQVRDWLERAVERLSPAQELAHDGPALERVARPQDLAARLREAWELRQARTEAHEVLAPEREASLSLADRLRTAAQGIDREALAERARALQQERQAEQRVKAQEIAHERAKELAREHEKQLHRDDGLDHGL